MRKHALAAVMSAAVAVLLAAPAAVALDVDKIQRADLARIDDALDEIRGNGLSVGDEEYLRTRAAVIEAAGVDAAGRNIVLDGTRGGKTPSDEKIAAETSRLSSSLYTPEAPERPAEPETVSAAPAATGGGAGGDLASIRACESGGDYTTNTGNGYFGAYQFDLPTWQAAGGTGNPASASPAEQDAVAAAWIAAGHRSAWPNC